MESELPEGWRSVGPEADNILRELRSELAPGHALHGLKLTLLAVREDQDDILVHIDDASQYRYAVVHLSWQGTHHNDVRFPITRFFNDLTLLQSE